MTTIAVVAIIIFATAVLLFILRRYIKFLFKNSALAYFSGNFHTVEKGKCYRSGKLSTKKLIRYTKQYSIKSIINLRGKQEYKRWWKKEQKFAKDYKIKLINIPLNTWKFPNKKHLAKLINTFKTTPKPILIHCQHGTDRTSMASALWVIEQMGGSKNVALKQLSFLRYGHAPLFAKKMKPFINLWCNLRKDKSTKEALLTYSTKKKIEK